MTHLPLISPPHLDAVFAWREGKPALVRDFLHDALPRNASGSLHGLPTDDDPSGTGKP